MIVISFNIMATIQDEALLNFSDSDEVASETEDYVSRQSSSLSEDDSDAEQITGHAILSRNKSIEWKAQLFPQMRRLVAHNVVHLTPGPTRYVTSRIFK